MSETSGRALLVGAPTGGLGGVEAAIERFASLLESRGFRATRLIGGDASREGMLSAFDRIGQELRRDEPFVFYYAGHGYRWVPKGASSPQVILVLPGTRSSTADQFLGLLGAELKQRLASLTEVTRNMTSVVDCCHSEGLIDAIDPNDQSEDMLAMMRARIGEDIAAKPRRAEKSDGRLELIVRLAATSTHERAYGKGQERDAVGLFTHTLVDVLEDHPHEPWETVITRVRARVQARRRTQRPDVHGPWNRIPFTLEERVCTREPCIPVPDTWALPGTALLEAQHGDTYLLSLSDSTSGVVQAQVIVIQPDRVLVRPESSHGLHGQELLWASPHRPHSPYVVAVAPAAGVARLRHMVDPQLFELHPVSADQPVSAKIQLESDRMVLHDHLGDRVAVMSAEPTPLELEAWLRRLATFRRCMENLRRDESLEGALGVRWMSEMEPDLPVAATSSSAPTLDPGSTVRIELEHRASPYHALHVVAFQFTAKRTFRPLTGPSAAGVAVRRGSCERIELCLGGPSETTDEGRPHHEGIVLVAATHPLALHGLHFENDPLQASKRGIHGQTKPARSTSLLLYRIASR